MIPQGLGPRMTDAKGGARSAVVRVPQPQIAAPPALEVTDAGVVYPGVIALREFDLDVMAGEVHAVVGHNGSGKSTLVKLLAGQCQPTKATSVRVGGEDLQLCSPRDSARLGLRFVHQDLGLVPDLSITENLSLGAIGRAPSLSRIRWRQEHERARKQLARLGYSVDPRKPIRNVPKAIRGAVAIARALQDGDTTPARVLVIDEVTATMTGSDIERLLATLSAIRETGVAVLYVSHHLEEVLQVADRVTVLQDGVKIETSLASALTASTLADRIVGDSHHVSQALQAEAESAIVNDTEHGENDGVICEVSHLQGSAVRDISFSVRAGAILGIAGIAGSGREELSSLLMGGEMRAGDVTVDGHSIPPGRPHRSLRHGVALVPADRTSNAVIPDLAIRENLTLAHLAPFMQRGWLSRRREREEVRKWIQQLQIRGATVDGSMASLSGGNQQKVMLARALRIQPRLLLLDEPTQGVDVGSVAEIHGIIKGIAQRSAIIIFSSDAEELTSLCAEVLVMRSGTVAAHLTGSQITRMKIMRLELAAEDAGESSGPIVEETTWI
jgi:ribose transport system ATP-binding protein